MYISNKFLKFSVYELSKIRHILKIKYVYCVVHVALKTLLLFVTFIHTYAYAHADIHTHIYTHTHTHTHTLTLTLTLTLTQIKTLHFLERSRKQIHEHTDRRNLIQVKFKIFNKNIRSNKDSGQIERKKLTYLHYLNKMIGKYKLRKFIFSEVSSF